jgi:hypothetical protein
VPVAERIAGTDTHIKGFRYYVSRPYLAVTGRIKVAETKTRALLVPVHDPVACGDGWGLLTYERGPCGVPVPRLLTLDGLPAPEAWRWKHTPSAAPPPMTKVEPTAFTQAAPPGPVPTGGACAAPDLNVCLEAAVTVTPPPPILPPPDGEEPEGQMRVVYLPDFEEQVAVKDCNFLARSKYSLLFRDGWQLLSVDGTHDATEVAVRMLETVRQAIGLAGEVEARRISDLPVEAAPLPPLGPPAGPREFKGLVAIRVEITRTLYIEPGFYRLNKASEMADDECRTGAGVLADMGIATIEERQLRRLGENE